MNKADYKYQISICLYSCDRRIINIFYQTVAKKIQQLLLILYTSKLMRKQGKLQKI